MLNWLISIYQRTVESLNRFSQSFFYFVFNGAFDLEYILRRIDGFVRPDAFKNEKFRLELERARLLLYRLNDRDIASGTANAYLLCVSNKGLDALYNIWIAYYHIIARARKLDAEGWEINPNWWSDADSAALHIWNRCEIYLSDNDRYVLNSQVGVISADAFKAHRSQEVKYGTSSSQGTPV